MCTRFRTRILSLGLTLALMLTAWSPASAAENIKLKDGTILTGDATAYEDATKTLVFQTEDDVVHRLPLDQLDGRSVYLVNTSLVPKDSGSGQLQIGNLARDVELYVHAVRHYKYAVAADPSLQAEVDRQMVVLRKEAADYCMRRAQEAIDKRDSVQAEKWLTILVQKLPDEPQAKTAAAMLDKHYTIVRTQRDEEQSQKQSEELTRALQPAKRYYDAMVANNKKGLMNTRATSSAVRSWKTAIQNGNRSLNELAKVTKKQDDPQTVTTLNGYKTKVEDQLIEVYLNLASQYTTRTSYQNALSEVNNALGIDPSNKAALAARGRIEVASSNNGWGILR